MTSPSPGSPTGPPAEPPTGSPGGPPPDRPAALARVRALLEDAGVPDEEIDRAVDDDVVDLLAVDRLLMPRGQRFTTADISARTGLPADVLRRFWRALGFVEPAEDEPALTELDLQAVELFQTLVRLGVTDVATAVQLARVIGTSMARIAEAGVLRAGSSLGAEEDSVLAADAFIRSAGELLPAMDRLLEYVWRRHLQAVTRRTMLVRTRGSLGGTRQDLAVGFADLVGFTVLSQHLSDAELAAVVQRFEEISYEIVTGLGGRVVKMIGDEAMFVVEDAVDGVRIALSLAEAYAHDDLLSDVRVGLAAGPVLVNDGDYFGPTVNLASRIVNIASPGAVLVSDTVHAHVDARAQTDAGVRGELRFARLAPRELKDLGAVQLWWCGRPWQEPSEALDEAEARRRVRWERLGEVRRELEQLRDVGERFLGARRTVR